MDEKEEERVIRKGLRAGRIVVCYGQRNGVGSYIQGKAGSSEQDEEVLILQSSRLCGPDRVQLPPHLMRLLRKWEETGAIHINKSNDTYVVDRDLEVGSLYRACLIAQGAITSNNPCESCFVSYWEGTMKNNLGASVPVRLDALTIRDVAALKTELRVQFGLPTYMNPVSLDLKDRVIMLGDPLVFTHRLDQLEHEGEEDFILTFMDSRSLLSRAMAFLFIWGTEKP